MSVVTVYNSPASYELIPAYRDRGVLITAEVNTGDPVVYFDVYFNDIYYKTFTSTISIDTGIGTITTDVHQIDIQTAVQEYLSSPVGQSIDYSGAWGYSKPIAKCFIKVRSSYFSGNLIVPDGTPPVQGTAFTPPVTGDGMLSEIFYVFNAAQQLEDNYAIEDKLKYLFKNTYGVQASGYRLYPLSNAPYFDVTMTDFGHFPILIGPGGFNGAATANYRLKVVAELYSDPGNLGHEYVYGVSAFPNNIVLYNSNYYYLPCTPRSIELMQALSGVLINWQDVKQYRVEVFKYPVPGTVVGSVTSPLFHLSQDHCKHTRLRFLNYWGAYESTNFDDAEETLKVSSGDWKKPFARNQYPFATSFPRSAGQGATQRFNVASNEEFTVTGIFQEEQMQWLKELFASPSVLLEWNTEATRTPSTNPDGTISYVVTNGYLDQYADLLPIRILDVDFVTQKSKAADRYEYLITIKYQMANENLIHRN